MRLFRVIALTIAMVLPGMASSSPAGDGAWSIRVVPHTAAPRSGSSHAEDTARGVRIDLGPISLFGAAPQNGRRVVVDGTAFFVSTVVVEVTRAASTLGVPRGRSVTVARPSKDDGLPTRTPTLSAPASRPQASGASPRVDLYARLLSGDADIRLAEAGTIDWEHEGAGIALGGLPTLVASGLGDGDRVWLEIALIADAADSGMQIADVQLELH